MVFYPYSFQAAFDPNQGTTAPRDSVGQVFAVGDRTFSNPLPTVDLNGLPVTLTVGEFGYLPDFMVEDHTAVVWKSGEYVFQFATTIPVKGDEGEVGKSAYQSAVEQGFTGTEAEWLESLKGANVLPTDEAIAAALTDGGLAQAATKALADASAQAEVAPVVEQVQQLEQSAVRATQAADRAYTVKNVPANAGIPRHTIIRLANGVNAGRTLHRITGGDSYAPAPPRETLDQFYAKTGASVIVNGSGWWAGEGFRFMGLSIYNGVLVQGWDPMDSDLGQEAAVIMKNGELRMYDNTTPPTQIIEEGGWHSFSWGAAFYKNGAITNFQDNPRYSPVEPRRITGRQLIGDTLDGDLLIITFPGVTDVWGASAQDILAAVANLNINNLYLMDGGGSAQTMVDGKYQVPSSDGSPRAVPDALYFYAPRSGPRLDTKWTAITQRNTGWSGGAVEYRVTNEQVYVRVIGLKWAGPGAASLSTICTLPDDVPRPPWQWTGLAYLNTKPTESQNCLVSSAGAVQFSASAPGDVSHIFQYPI